MALVIICSNTCDTVYAAAFVYGYYVVHHVQPHGASSLVGPTFPNLRQSEYHMSAIISESL